MPWQTTLRFSKFIHGISDQKCSLDTIAGMNLQITPVKIFEGACKPECKSYAKSCIVVDIYEHQGSTSDNARHVDISEHQGSTPSNTNNVGASENKGNTPSKASDVDASEDKSSTPTKPRAVNAYEDTISTPRKASHVYSPEDEGITLSTSLILLYITYVLIGVVVMCCVLVFVVIFRKTQLSRNLAKTSKKERDSNTSEGVHILPK